MQDIAVLDAGAARLRIPDPSLGMVIPVFVAVENQGDWTPWPETFEVSAFYDTTLIGTILVDLESGGHWVVSINWNLEALPNGVYTISANASVLPEETDTADNYLRNGDVLKTIFADVTGDGIVDLFDLFALGKAYNSATHSADLNSDGIVDLTDGHIMWAAASSNWQSESPNWNPYADLDGDGYIGSADAGILNGFVGVTGDPHWNLHADMNADNAIDLSDLLDLSNNYGATGP